jgi:outer membrane protein assembly factor BamB
MSDPRLSPTGDSYLDALRLDVFQRATDLSNFRERTLILKLFAATLQQLGINLQRYLEVDAIIGSHRFHSYRYVSEPDEIFLTAVDRGFAVLEELLAEHGFALPPPRSGSAAPPIPDVSPYEDWPAYQKDSHHTGFTPSPGPTEGECAWKFPISLNVRARPVIEDGFVYVASPGMRVSMYKLDAQTGQVVWTCRRAVDIVDDQLYHTPSLACTPQIVGDEIVARELGSRGNTGWARHLVFVDKETGQERRKVEACHIDYRAGYAPFAADAAHLIYPHGVHDIEQTPPQAAPLDVIRCVDFNTGEVLWDFFVGPMFGEPTLTEDSVYVGTLHGDVFCLKRDGAWPRQRRARMRWAFKCEGAVNTRIVVAGQQALVASNDGGVYALDKDSGQIRWRWQAPRTENRAFRLYSTPLVHDDRLYIGSADGYLYCLNASDGGLRWEYAVGEWVRAAPAVMGDRVYVAALDGKVHCLTDGGDHAELVWTIKVAEHHLLSDLVAADGLLFINSSDLYLHCIDQDGVMRWQHSLIESSMIDGVRVLTDQIAGGSYYTGKPTAVGDHVFIGTFSGFVHALDESTGTEAWRFECGAGVSAAPTYANGRIYFGQQGGEDAYYCLDAGSGDLLWKQSLGWVWGSATVADGRVFVPGIDGFANCLDAQTGAILWRYRTSRSTCSEPVVDGDTVYFGGWDHYLYAFDTRTGALRWKYHVDGALDSGAPLAVGGRVYVPSGDSDRFRCLDGDSGTVLWEFQRERTNFNATPSYDGERIYISINQGTGLCGVWVCSTVCCLDAETGQLLWEHEGGGIPGTVIAGDSVYFGSSESPFLYCVDRLPNESGQAQLRWKYNLAGRMWETTPAISRGKAIVLSDNGYLCAIR